jgi:hypothetical protein
MNRHRGLTLVALALSCDSNQTAIVLEAQSEMPPEALDQVVFRVSGPGLDGGTQEALAPLTGPAARHFPLTLVLVGSGAGSGGPFTVSIEGRKGGTAVAQGVPLDAAPVAFVPGKVSRHRFVLRPLGGADAGAGPMSVPPGARTMPPGCGPGCVCAQSCTKDHPCTCRMGCACQFTCAQNDRCDVDCGDPGTTCHVDVSNAKMANVRCASAALCVVRGGAMKRDSRFTCSNAECEVDCTQDASCQLACTDGARCLLRCNDGESCKLDCPGGMVRDCQNNVRVCNRDCPP